MKCKMCDSYAINHNMHGRDGSNPDLCDVCYWRNKYEELLKNTDKAIKLNKPTKLEFVSIEDENGFI